MNRIPAPLALLVAAAASAALSLTACDRMPQSTTGSIPAPASEGTVTTGQAVWTESYQAATTRAQADNKLLLMDFTGSDWCPPCKKLKAEVFSKADFAEFTKDKFVLVEIDSPMQRKLPKDVVEQNDSLKEKYNITGFPTTLIADAQGKEIKRVVGFPGREEYMAMLREVARR